MYLKTLVHSDSDKSTKLASLFNSSRSGKLDATPHDISFDSLERIRITRFIKSNKKIS